MATKARKRENKEEKEKKEKLYKREAIEALIIAILGFFVLTIILDTLALIVGIKVRQWAADDATRGFALAAIIISSVALGLVVLGMVGAFSYHY